MPALGQRGGNAVERSPGDTSPADTSAPVGTRYCGMWDHTARGSNPSSTVRSTRAQRRRTRIKRQSSERRSSGGADSLPLKSLGAARRAAKVLTEPRRHRGLGHHLGPVQRSTHKRAPPAAARRPMPALGQRGGNAVERSPGDTSPADTSAPRRDALLRGGIAKTVHDLVRRSARQHSRVIVTLIGESLMTTSARLYWQGEECGQRHRRSFRHRELR